MEKRIPRVMIAGTNSGCGKTTVTCAVLQALINRHLKVGAFKCGPDYIDPMFHSRIIGAKSSNLDLNFFTKNSLKNLVVKNGSEQDINIMEGVMGFYDGMSLTSLKASSYEVSKCTGTPVILAVNARGAALSVLATISGFLNFCPDHLIRGVILNQCSPMSYSTLAAAITDHFQGRIVPLGFLPPMKDCILESRHLGLVTADEVKDLKGKLQKMAEQAEKTLDLQGILELAGNADPIFYDAVSISSMGEPVRIAVARDPAFCFYYEDSLDVLREMGAELIPFSPLRDAEIPSGIQGLYLGGGYPELYAEQLSQNASMRNSIRKALADGLPCIAECGGFMYLTEAIDAYPMVGVLKGSCSDQGKLIRFGYVTLEAKQDNMLCRAGERIQAHEFHHWDTTENGASFKASKVSGKSWDCVVSSDRLYAGFPHFHFYSNLHFAENFYRTCMIYKGEQRYD